MNVASAIECTPLDGLFLEPFKRFAVAFIANRLDDISNRKLFGAMYGGIPVGLAVVHTAADTKAARIESFLIDQRYRRQGIGRRLLECTEEGTFEDGAGMIEATWLADSSSTRSFQGLFECRGWSKPNAGSFLYRYTGEGIDHFLGNTKTRKLPDGFEFFRWKDRTQEDDAEVDSLDREYNIEVGLHPRGEPFMPIDEEKTVGLYQKGKLVGWMLLHRAAAKITRYTSLWVIPSLVGRGMGISLAAEACRRHRQLMDEDDLGFFVSSANNSEMQRFVARRLHDGFMSISSCRISPLLRTVKTRQDSSS